IRPRPYSRKKHLPNSAGPKAHGMTAFVPLIEIADNANHFRVGSPHGKTHARHAFAGDQVSAHRSVALVAGPLAVEVKAEIGQQWTESIGIVDCDLPAIPQR